MRGPCRVTKRLRLRSLRAFSNSAPAPARAAPQELPGAVARPPRRPLRRRSRASSWARNRSRSPGRARSAFARSRSRRRSSCEATSSTAAEVGQAEPLREPIRDRLERALPRLDVDVRRRRRRHRELVRRDAHAGHVPDVGVAGRLVEVGHVVARVARDVGDAKSLDLLPAAQRDDVGGRHGQHLAPEALHVVAVQPACALQQLLRIDEMRRPDLVHVHAQVREPLDERARRAGVIEVDVGEEERARLALEAREQRLETRRGARIDDQRRPPRRRR